MIKQPKCVGDDPIESVDIDESNNMESSRDEKASSWWAFGDITNVVKKTVKGTTDVFKEQVCGNWQII